MKSYFAITLTLFAAFSISSCSTSAEREDPFNDKEPSTNSVFNEASKKVKESRIKPKDAYLLNSHIEIHEGMFLLGDIKEVVTPLPVFFEQKVTLSMVNVKLPKIATRLTEITGVQFHLATDLRAETKSSQNSFSIKDDGASVVKKDGTSVPPSSAINRVLNGSPIDSGANQISNSSGQQASEDKPSFDPYIDAISFSHNDSLEQLLDLISGRYSISWRWNENTQKVMFYRLMTRTFKVKFPGESVNKIETKTAGSEGSTDQSTKFVFSTGDWDEIEDSVKTFLSPYGSTKLVRSSGNILVTDTPSVVKKVAEYIRDLNNKFVSQVALDVKVYSVSLSNKKNLGISFSALTKSLSNGGSVILDGAGINTNALAGSLKFTPSGDGLTGSSFIEALSQQGEVSQVTSTSSQGISNQPIPIKVVEEVAYISGESSQDQVAGGSVPRTTVETDKIDVGFSMTLVPQIYGENSLNLHITIELTELKELKEFDTTLVQTPVLDKRMISQRVLLNSGETLVLAGLEQTRSNKVRQGMGHADFWFFGGGKAEEEKRDVLVVVITPRIIYGTDK